MDLVITDLEMPEGNSLEVIVELPWAFLDVKVIAMSGRSTEDLQKVKLIGARRTFPKPLDLPALLHAVQYELQHEPQSRNQAMVDADRLGPYQS